LRLRWRRWVGESQQGHRLLVGVEGPGVAAEGRLEVAAGEPDARLDRHAPPVGEAQRLLKQRPRHIGPAARLLDRAEAKDQSDLAVGILVAPRLRHAGCWAP
jgi:hypothetical protein